MSEIVSIIHFSDLHIRNEAEKSTVDPTVKEGVNHHEVIKNLVGRALYGKYHNPHVVITGDITDTATPEAFSVTSSLLKPLIDQNALTIVPGNHDDPFTRFGRTRGLDLFNESFRHLFNRTQSSHPSGYPFVRLLDHVALIGLNSAHNTRRLSATGSIGKEQLEYLGYILERPEIVQRFKVLMLHHHPYVLKKFDMLLDESVMELTDAEDLRDTIAGRMDLVLFGHKHKRHILERKFDVPLWVCSSSTIEPDGKYYSFRVFEIFKPGRINHYTNKIRVEEGSRYCAECGLIIEAVGQRAWCKRCGGSVHILPFNPNE